MKIIDSSEMCTDFTVAVAAVAAFDGHPKHSFKDDPSHELSHRCFKQDSRHNSHYFADGRRFANENKRSRGFVRMIAYNSGSSSSKIFVNEWLGLFQTCSWLQTNVKIFSLLESTAEKVDLSTAPSWQQKFTCTAIGWAPPR